MYVQVLNTLHTPFYLFYNYDVLTSLDNFVHPKERYLIEYNYFVYLFK